MMSNKRLVVRRQLAGLCLLSLTLSACAVGPTYRRPNIETPETFRGADEVVDSTSIADMAWWDVFQDPALKQLVEEALANNYDLRVAATRVEQARFAVGVTRADLVPQVGYEGGAQRGKTFNPFGDNATDNQFFGALQLAWEIDVWGRIRRATEAAQADLMAAEDVRRAVILSLVTGVAQAYFELRELDLELAIAERTRDSFGATLDLFERQLRGGVGNKLATSRAEASLAATSAAIPELQRQIVAKENQLSILLGRAPSAIPRGTALIDQAMPPSVPAGLPAGLLERRPDILQAEQNVVAANALVGVSVANFLPRIGLTSFVGSTSSELDNLLKNSTGTWGLGTSILGPLFQGGRLYYTYKGSQAAYDEAVLLYEQTVLTALGEVSNALVAREKLELARQAQERQVAALREAVRLATLRYTGGLAGYFEVLEAQQQLFPAENALARTRLEQLVTIVRLYRALGGGWRTDQPPRASDATS